ncbi:hypothetical protein [Fundidesulfovibrio terrae]|uniref:hypothetical protein n=1 Tax=Fundidesulfovibrio terrae TaxID=2922866 RepID=UPI001FAEE756|nr:hypothetical protein [Fundidesulfovibrio terrae]
MADEYADNLADSYIRTNDGKGDTMGENFNGGVVAMPLTPGEVRAPISGEIRDTVSNRRLGEDPLFTAMAGDSKEFVGGIPKEQWDSMTPEQRDRLVRGTEDDRKRMGEYGAAIGGGIGALASLPAYGASPVAGGLATGVLGGYGAARGYNKGYDMFDKASPPPTISRETLRQQYEDAKGRE